MAQALDVTTAVAAKCRAITATGTPTVQKDVTTGLRAYLNTEIADATSVARKDLNTRVWLDLPHT